MLTVSRSPHLKQFKEALGQANHYLITILIGLEGVRTGAVTKGDSFNVSWSPRSIDATVNRSRRYARQSGLTWAVNALEGYLGYLRRHPFRFPSDFDQLLQNDRSVFSLLNKVITFTGYPIDLPLSITHIGIQWRNNVVHYHAENELDQAYATFLRNVDRSTVGERFSGLDPHLMLEGFNEREAPRFKELAAIIQSIHYLVLELDSRLVTFIDPELMLKDILSEHALEARHILSAAPGDRERKMKQYLITHGFKDVTSKDASNGIDDARISRALEEMKAAIV